MKEFDIRRRLIGAVDHLNGERAVEAIELLDSVLEIDPAQPQALTLKGVAEFRRKNLDTAETLLQKALHLSPEQPNILLHLGNIARKKGRPADAVTLYRRALRARPDFEDAALALANILEEVNADEAEANYRSVLAAGRAPRDAVLGLARCLNRRKDYNETEQLLQPISGTSEDAELETLLGEAKLFQRRFAQALGHFDQAVAIEANATNAQRRRATALEYLHRENRALSAYRAVLEREPADLRTHLLLNELLHRTGRTEEMFKSYDVAARRVPNAADLYAAKGQQLLLANRPDDAMAAFQRALKDQPEHLGAMIGTARAHAKCGRLNPAQDVFARAVRVHPADPAALTAHAYFSLGQGDARFAEGQARAALRVDPTSQPALAVLSLCLRGTDPAREEELAGYQSLIGVFDLPSSAATRTRMDFVTEMSRHLTQLHQGSREYFSQTLRGGTRAAEPIFEYRNTLRDALLSQIMAATKDYLGTLQGAPDHPFLRRRSRGLRLAGSWSSRMCQGGHHQNHIHEGWISGVYYVDVPDCQAASLQKGWIKFGEPPPDLNLDTTSRRTIQPLPGRLILFPSYMWHGTIPIDAIQPRTTIAFDLVPA